MHVEVNTSRGKEMLYQDASLNNILLGFSKAVKKHNTSVVILCDGRSGMGKTTLITQVASVLDPDFGLHKIHFLPKSFLEGGEFEGEHKTGLADAKPGDFILFDEAMIIMSRSAMSALNKMIIQAMSMIRSKKIFVGFCVNSIFDLDRNLVLHRADLLLHVYGRSLVDRGRFAAFFRGRDGYDRLKSLYVYGKANYYYGRPKSNFIGKFTSKFVVDEAKYEKSKRHGVNAFLRNGSFRGFDKLAATKKFRELGLKYKEIGEVLGVSEQVLRTSVCNNRFAELT